MPAPGTLLLGPNPDTVVGAGAQLGDGVKMMRCVVWESEVVPSGFEGADGVWANGTFYPCGASDQGESPAGNGSGNA